MAGLPSGCSYQDIVYTVYLTSDVDFSTMGSISLTAQRNGSPVANLVGVGSLPSPFVGTTLSTGCGALTFTTTGSAPSFSTANQPYTGRYDAQGSLPGSDTGLLNGSTWTLGVSGSSGGNFTLVCWKVTVVITTGSQGAR